MVHVSLFCTLLRDLAHVPQFTSKTILTLSIMCVIPIVITIQRVTNCFVALLSRCLCPRSPVSVIQALSPVNVIVHSDYRRTSRTGVRYTVYRKKILIYLFVFFLFSPQLDTMQVKNISMPTVRHQVRALTELMLCCP